MSDKPKWDCPIRPDIFERLIQPVQSVRLSTEFFSEDSWRTYPCFKFASGADMEMPSAILDYATFKPTHNSLFSLTPLGNRVKEQLSVLKKWETENNTEYLEYLKLKEKFE